MIKILKLYTRQFLDLVSPSLLYSTRSYSQDGEDMILKSFYEDRKNYKGYYIDIGAHHPFRFSNTCYFYNKGWSGINIEPTPNLFKHFKKHRKRDINLNIGICDKKGLLTFFLFNESALNSFDKELSLSRENNNYKIVGKQEIEVERLDSVLDNYLPKNQKIDFLTIDVEGLDFEVLKSNNWSKYKPDHILIESNLSLDNINDNDIYTFLNSLGYQLIAQTLRTSIFTFTSS